MQCITNYRKSKFSNSGENDLLNNYADYEKKFTIDLQYGASKFVHAWIFIECSIVGCRIVYVIFLISLKNHNKSALKKTI